MGRVSDAKEKLIEAAFLLIWERSYFSTGVNEICQKAGVKPGSFYYFFPSKEELAAAALSAHWAEMKETVLDHAFNNERRPLERIEEFFRMTANYHSHEQKSKEPVLGCAFGSIVGELSAEENEIRRQVTDFFNELKQYFQTALRDAQQEGEINVSDAEISKRAEAIMAYFEGVLIIARARNDSSILKDAPFFARKLACS